MSKTSEATTTHSALYRTYRPSNFKEVIGQEHVVSVLEEAIKQGKIAHAYLFCGSRGTGKTSVARIFAKALGTSPNDLYEIDAASNTSVDDIRELSEAVNTVPFESRYKVYILDEVHMLSKAAFNAFLKTLEEPPKHVIFILATTEMEKLPDTIVSRCETYIFKKPQTEMLKKHVVDIAKKEGATLESAAAELVALLGDGSFRDTLSTLQKVLTLSGKEITLADVERITGAPKASIVLNFVKGLLTKNASESIKALNDAAKENLDMKVFSKLAMMRLRYALMKTISESEAKMMAEDISETDTKEIDVLVKQASGNQIASTLKAMLTTQHTIGKSHIASLPLEILVAELTENKQA
jgi:DNA polymerase-3 subunit gamma/tau